MSAVSANLITTKKGKLMTYDEMLKEVSSNHSAHWGGTYEEMKASDTRLANLAEEYPALYREALDAYNEMLRNM